MRNVAFSIGLFTITYRFWKQYLCVRETPFRLSLLVYNLSLWKLFDLEQSSDRHNKEICVTCFYYIYYFLFLVHLISSRIIFTSAVSSQ